MDASNLDPSLQNELVQAGIVQSDIHNLMICEIRVRKVRRAIARAASRVETEAARARTALAARQRRVPGEDEMTRVLVASVYAQEQSEARIARDLVACDALCAQLEAARAAMRISCAAAEAAEVLSNANRFLEDANRALTDPRGGVRAQIECGNSLHGPAANAIIAPDDVPEAEHARILGAARPPSGWGTDIDAALSDLDLASVSRG